jgi:hypothetical protein
MRAVTGNDAYQRGRKEQAKESSDRTSLFEPSGYAVVELCGIGASADTGDTVTPT